MWDYKDFGGTLLVATTLCVTALGCGSAGTAPAASGTGAMPQRVARQPGADPAVVRDLIERTDEVIMGVRERGGSSGRKVVLMSGRYGSTSSALGTAGSFGSL